MNSQDSGLSGVYTEGLTLMRRISWGFVAIVAVDT